VTPNRYATLVDMVRLSNLLLFIVFIMCHSHISVSNQSMKFGNLVLVLEGGYNFDVLAECASACIKVLSA
jgi:hypothetical protein